MHKTKWERSLFIKAISIIALFFAVEANGQTRVAIIDSGILPFPSAKLCDSGHYDFINNLPIVGMDIINHGTNVAKAITENASTADYCLLIYKVFDEKTKKDFIPNAIKKAIQSNADIINLAIDSNNGYDADEYNMLWAAGNKGIQIFLSSGNSGINLDKNCKIYPVCYKNILFTIVGNKESYSNHGKLIDLYEASCYNSFCGTSASVAIATGKFIADIKHHQYCVDEYKKCISKHECNNKPCTAVGIICRDNYKQCEGK